LTELETAAKVPATQKDTMARTTATIVALALLILGFAGPAAAQYTIHEGMQNLPNKGPAAALGVVIWNHGVEGSREQSHVPPPYVGTLMRAGWDVRRIARDAINESNWTAAGQRHVTRTLEEIEKSKADGYKRVVLAGQSYGGAITLEAATRAEVWAIIPSAPGIGISPSHVGTFTDQNQGTNQLFSALTNSKAARAVGILPFQDEFALSSPERGRRSREIASSRGLPYLALDEESGLVAHGASSSALMNFAYGACVARFLDPEFEPKTGVNLCGEGGLPVGPRRLKETDDLKPARMPSDQHWIFYQGVWTGAWTNPALLSVAIERDGNDHFLVYLLGQNGSDKLSQRTRTPAVLEGRLVVSQLPDRKITLIYDNATRQVRLRWDDAQGRFGSTLLKKDRDP
jgi:pimeloyl-ACP methyl ester carboxylesterase